MYTHYCLRSGTKRSKGKITKANLIMLGSHLPNHGRFDPRHQSVDQKIAWIARVLAAGLEVTFPEKKLTIEPLTLAQFQALEAQPHVPEPQPQEHAR